MDSLSKAFEILVEQALDDLPAWVQERMENVAIVVAEWPSAEQLRALRARPGSRGTGMLLGLYEGVPLTRRTHGYHLAAPDRITLFRGPLLRQARDGADLRRLIRRTIIHEIAHHFGFGEQQLRELDC
mgnify:FL=1